MRQRLLFGTDTLDVELPEATRVIEPPPSLEALRSPVRALRRALAEPVGQEPLRRLVGPGAKVTIAFDDPTVTFMGVDGPDPRELTLGVLLEELTSVGVKLEDIRLLFANALHRKWSQRELATVLGSIAPFAFGPDRFGCHDAYDTDQLVHLGATERGIEVEVNRAILDSDQFIYVNVTPSPFNGGWKSTVVGLSTFRSIRYHHRPYPFSTGKSVMDPERSAFPKLLAEQGAVLEQALAEKGRRLFQIEWVLTSLPQGRPAHVVAGHPAEAHQATLDALMRQHVVPTTGQSDVLVLGLPDTGPYSALSHPNPILMANAALGYAFALHVRRPLVHEEGFLIVANPFTDRWHPRHHRSYPEVFTLLGTTRDPVELWDGHAEEFAERPEYVHAYRFERSFHGAHPLFLWGQVMRGRAQLGEVIVAGGDPAVCERLGFRRAGSVEEALAVAAVELGRMPTVTYQPMPPLTIPEVRLSPEEG